MDEAEKKALEIYPKNIVCCEEGSYDMNLNERLIYICGYRDAQKNNSISWNDIKLICDIFMDVGLKSNLPGRSKGLYEEILKNYNIKKQLL